MNKPEVRILKLAESVSDREIIDWEQWRRSIGENPERRLVDSLNLLDIIAGAHRPDLLPDRLWGHLEIKEEIGSGAFSVVHRAHDTQLDRDVALKLFHRGAKIEDDRLDRVLREARRLARISHPNVVHVYGVEEHDGRPGLWMEWVRGRTLAEEVAHRGPLSEREALRIGLDLCRALSAVHAAGLIHRDIKAQNVMRDSTGRIVLMDFGTGIERTKTGDPEGPHTLAGTPLYLAPELLAGGAPGFVTDVYSLGVLLFFLVSGRHPVETGDLEELKAMHKTGAGRPDFPPSLSRQTVSVISKALAPNPRERFPDARMMERAVRDLDSLSGDNVSPNRGWNRLAPILGTAVIVLVLAILLGPGLRERWTGASGAFSVEASLLRGVGENALPIGPGALVQPGDALSLRFSASDPLHVYVLNRDEAGEAYLLFPLVDHEPTNPLPPETTHYLPGRRGGTQDYWLVTSAGGEEQLLLVASPKPLQKLEEYVATLPWPRSDHPVVYPRMDQETLRTMRGLGGLLSGEEPRPTDDLFDHAIDLAMGPEKNRGVYIRKISLRNPGSADSD